MKRILVIEDDDGQLHMLKSFLTKHHYDVLTSHDAEKGIYLAKIDHPDLILMDIILPGISGMEAVRLMREDPLTKKIPIIFITGVISNENERIGIDSVMVEGNSYILLSKPFKSTTLLENIKTFVG